MPHLTLEDLKKLNGFKFESLVEFDQVSRVCIDSRIIERGDLYVAIKGNNFDGHSFIKEAFAKGAKAVLVNKRKASQIVKENEETNIFSVSDTTKALGELARIWRFKLKCDVLALTGSVGKTTTKELIASILSTKFKTQKTFANNNNHIGVPLTIFSAGDEIEKLVLECGSNHPGEIEYLAEIAQPDYALITMIGDSHLEFLINRNGVFKEKKSLFDVTLKREGKIFVNLDDKYLRKYANVKNAVAYSFVEKKANYFGEILSFDKLYRPKIRINKGQKIFQARLPLFGESAAQNFLAAFAVCSELGVSFSEIKKALKELKPIDKRLKVLDINTSIIIEDYYNANPQSMKEALRCLAHIKKERKIAILGDMFELGEVALKEHVNLKKPIIDANVNSLFLIGKNMKNLYEKIKNNKNIETKYFSNREKMKEYLLSVDFKNSAVLIKGSRGMKMEDFLEIVKQKL
jgi:UDP-N-acetylmuramoyl-tripeptide--D-alanyl-D-alanine ligase